MFRGIVKHNVAPNASCVRACMNQAQLAEWRGLASKSAREITGRRATALALVALVAPSRSLLCFCLQRPMP